VWAQRLGADRRPATWRRLRPCCALRISGLRSAWVSAGGAAAQTAAGGGPASRAAPGRGPRGGVAAADYTDIAVKGTFVALAAEVLRDADLAYARARLRRLAAFIDESGSFSEYNSPIYGWVTPTDLERLRAHVGDGQSRDMVAASSAR